MPFQQDNAWPAGLLTIFDHARAKNTTFENRYYGPYDKLLNYCFGESFAFYVAPQNPLWDDDAYDFEFIVFIVIFDSRGKPLLVVEVKDDSWAQKAELRSRADKRMRSWCNLMFHECPLPRLWGISLLGTSMRVYCADKETYILTPASVARPEPLTRVLSPSFLAEGWKLDILSQEGFVKMKEIVADILTHVVHE